MELFPYKTRKNQRAIIDTIIKNVDFENNFIFESGTGSGKTICAIAATLTFALKNNKKIIYTTRTNAQQRQVILELREIKKKVCKNHDKIFGLGIQGRANMCILARNNSEYANGTSEELSKLCSNEKKKVISNNKQEGCIYFRKFIENKNIVEKILNWIKNDLPTAEETIEYCEKFQICPYELNKLLIKNASIVVVPYIYVFDNVIRNMLFDWLMVDEKDVILIVDEAHNLPEYIRDLFTLQLSLWMLQNCIIESDKYGNPTLIDNNLTVSFFCKLLMNIINDLKDTFIYNILEESNIQINVDNEDALIPTNEFETEIISRLKITSKKLQDIVNDLIAYGEKIQEYKQKRGKLPRSYVHKLGVFLEFWINLENNKYVKLIVDPSEGKNPRIEAYCLDPSVVSPVIKKFFSSIHMSGTLEPLEEYRDSMGLPQDSELVTYPSPYSNKNRKILYVDDVTTKYEEILKDKEIIDRMKLYISKICNVFPKNTMVFLPSFNYLSKFKRDFHIKNMNRCFYFEEQNMSQSALMDIVNDFKVSGLEKGKSATLFSVMGGRISEGMDFPAEQLEIALIVGIPYPKPTAKQKGLQRYYEIKFRKGWEYTVEAPTARKLLQSIGRLIRDEKDKGIAVILDKRASRFKKYIKDLNKTNNLIKDIEIFMNKYN
jgi:DNA excision repair protein ERCC-2